MPSFHFQCAAGVSVPRETSLNDVRRGSRDHGRLVTRKDADLNLLAAIACASRHDCAPQGERASRPPARAANSLLVLPRAAWHWPWLALCAWCWGYSPCAAQQTDLPQPSWHDRISIQADRAQRWPQGAYDCWLLSGNVYLNQGPVTTRSQAAVLWIEHKPQYGDEPTKVIVYLEDRVAIEYRYPDESGRRWGNEAARIEDKSWFGRFYSLAPLEIRAPEPGPEPKTKSPVFERGMARLDPHFARSVQQAAHLQAEPDATAIVVRTAGLEQPLDAPRHRPRARGDVELTQFTEFAPGPAMTDPLPQGMRRLRAFPRSDVRIQAQWFPSAGGNEWVAVISSGINLIIDGWRMAVRSISRPIEW